MGKKTAQNPAQQVHARQRRRQHVTSSAYKKASALQASGSPRESVRTSPVGSTGIEPIVKTSGKSTFIPAGGTESGTLGVNDGVIEVPADIDLHTIIDSWLFLSPSVRSKIVDLVRAEGQ